MFYPPRALKFKIRFTSEQVTLGELNKETLYLDQEFLQDLVIYKNYRKLFENYFI